jgi:hypothetical protein
MNTLEITCEKDISSFKKYDGNVSYNFFLLLSTKDCGVDVEQILCDFNEASPWEWEYSVVCSKDHYIFSAKVFTDFIPKLNDDKITFEVKSDYVPVVENRWIKVIK